MKQRSIYQTILSKFIQASLLPVLFIELSLVVALFWMNAKQSEVTKASLEKISSDAFSEIAQLTGAQLEKQFLPARHEIAQLSFLASQYFTYPQRYQVQSLQYYYDQGFFRNGVKGTKSSVYTTNITKILKKDEKNLQLLSLLFPHVKHLVDANSDLLQSSWINISKFYNLYYPKIDVSKELSHDLDVTKQAFYYTADPVHNPQKEVVFISIYNEVWATHFGQLGAFLSPIYTNNDFIGVIGVNVTVKKIAETFMELKLPFNAYAMLVDKEMRLLISSDEKRSFHDTKVHSYYSNYKRSLADKPLVLLEAMSKKRLLDDQKVIFSKKVTDTDFSIVFCADKDDIYGPVQRQYEQAKMIGYIIVIAITLFYGLYFLFMFRGIRRIATNISQPLREMMHFSSHLGQSKSMILPESNIEELQTLNSNFLQTNRRLIELINFDKTTGLYNHNKLRSDVQVEEGLTLIFFQLENFDQYNNLYGPSVGSFSLVEMSRQIKIYTEGMGKLYRENKDTVAWLTHDIVKDNVVDCLEKMFTKLGKEQLLFNGVDINLSIKAGVTLGDHKDGIDLLAQAHIALSEAVNRHVHRYIVYENVYEVTKRYEENLIWGKNVKEALDEKRLTAFFQPIYSYKNACIEKFESLVRMNLDTEIIPPSKFLDAAQSIGKLHAITLVMIDEVFLMAEKYPHIEFSVNTSFEDFEEGKLLDFVKEKLKTVKIDTSKVIFELLETQTFSNGELVSTMLVELKSLGFKLAIDDFGTGHSNFAHIASIDVDFIKIDGMFIKNVDQDEKSRKMVETMVSFAQEIGALTIGEFVHNKEVFDIVKRLGVDYAQGYYKGKPLSKEEVANLLE